MNTIKVNVDSTIAEIAINTYGSFVIAADTSKKYKIGKTKLVFPDKSSLIGRVKIEEGSVVFQRGSN